MKKLYEAENGLEAHMIVDLLQQAHLNARVDGELLQGAVGEIQVSGIVRVMVAEEDYEAAREVISQWEKKVPDSKTDEPIKQRQKSNFWMNLSIFFIGVIVGTSSAFYYFYAPISYDGIDHNGDGVRDEIWIYKNNRLFQAEIDKNFDGEIDLKYNYDRFGKIRTAISDDNFDGSFETKMKFKFGSVDYLEKDTTGDGFYNIKSFFKFGILFKSHFTDPETQKDIKIQYFNSWYIVREEVDTNSDGILDTVYEYDEVENIVRTYAK